jgi:hypothetical protein
MAITAAMAKADPFENPTPLVKLSAADSAALMARARRA